MLANLQHKKEGIKGKLNISGNLVFDSEFNNMLIASYGGG